MIIIKNMSNIYKYNSMSGILVFKYVAPEGKHFFFLKRKVNLKTMMGLDFENQVFKMHRNVLFR